MTARVVLKSHLFYLHLRLLSLLCRTAQPLKPLPLGRGRRSQVLIASVMPVAAGDSAETPAGVTGAEIWKIQRARHASPPRSKVEQKKAKKKGVPGLARSTRAEGDKKKRRDAGKE